MSKSFSIRLDDKPYLSAALKTNPKLAKEVIQTFVQLMEESFSLDKDMPWAELPEQLHKDLTFTALVRGVLRGALDVPQINPEAYDVLGVELHPLAMLSPRKNYIDGGMKYTNWRDHFKLPDDASVNEETVSQIFRKLLRYIRYVDIEALQRALESNQIASYRGIGHEQVAKLPFLPALRFQQKQFGDLHVGTFLDEIGAFDCGTAESIEECPACKMDDLKKVEKFAVCFRCNAGFQLEDNE